MLIIPTWEITKTQQQYERSQYKISQFKKKKIPIDNTKHKKKKSDMNIVYTTNLIRPDNKP